MKSKYNYGAINNNKSGVKYRFFNIVLCLCLGVVSVFGFMPKDYKSANAQVFDDLQDLQLSDSGSISKMMTVDFAGYFVIAGVEKSTTYGGYLHFYFYNFDGTLYDISLFTSYPRLVRASDNTSSSLNGSGYGLSTFADLSSYRAYFSYADSVVIHYLFQNTDICYLRINNDGTTEYFCSKVFYNMYLTGLNGYNSGLADGGADAYQNGYSVGSADGYASGVADGTTAGYNSGYTDGNTEGYNIGYSEGKSAGITEGTTSGYNSGYSEGYTAGYDKCEDDSVPLMQEKWQQGYDIGKGEGVLDGINQGYNQGYNAGLDDNQPLVYQAGYEEGHSVGKEFGREQGYNNAVEEYYSDQSNFKNLMFSIIDAPFNVLSNAFDFEIFGINMSSFLITIVSLLLVFFVIRKLM